MLFRKKKPKVQESADIGNINMETPNNEVIVNGVIPISYADAINDRRRRIAKFDNDFKEKNKFQDEFVSQQDDRESDTVTTEETQKMELNESLFDTCDSDTSKSIDEGVDNIKLYKRAEDLASKIEDFCTETSEMSDVNNYISPSEFAILQQSCTILRDFAMQYSYIMDNENLFEAVEAAPKQRSRGPRLKPEDKLDSEDDIYLQVYDELSAQTDHEGPAGDVHKNLKARKGDRYSEIFVGPGDNDLTIYGTKPEDFEFARKVADYYGVQMDEPKLDGNKTTNGYYRYKVIFRNLK